MSDTSDGPFGEILLYPTEDGRTRVECRFANETVWLSQALIAALFGVSVPTVNEHLKGIYADGEITPEATIRKFRMVRLEGGRQVTRLIDHYNLEAILAVGYRVRSQRGAQFRRWATERLGEYLVKGFTMDDARLKASPSPGGEVPDYFDELLARIRDIRASEQRMYLRVREIFALAADYAPTAAQSTLFFQTMQNKLHFAVTGQTAAELIRRRADHTQPNMGLTSSKGPNVQKADVGVAKNYLQEAEISELNRIVVMWLDFAEDQALRRRQVFLKDWEQRLNDFLRFNERAVLPNAGTMSHQEALDHARAEYELFAARRRVDLEAEGARVADQALEQAARALPERRGKKGKPA
jgi:hypothetical protein